MLLGKIQSMKINQNPLQISCGLEITADIKLMPGLLMSLGLAHSLTYSS